MSVGTIVCQATKDNLVERARIGASERVLVRTYVRGLGVDCDGAIGARWRRGGGMRGERVCAEWRVRGTVRLHWLKLALCAFAKTLRG